jgi:hypothetical protein
MRAHCIALLACLALAGVAHAQDATEPAIDAPSVEPPSIEAPAIEEPSIAEPGAPEDPADAPAIDEEPALEETDDEDVGELVPMEAPARAGLLADGSLDPCATDLRSRPIGPLQVSALDGQLGMPYRACPRAEIAIGGDALIVADTANFYGNVRASGRLRASMLLDPNVEGFVSWEPLRYQTVISSVSAAYLGLGYLSYGVTARVAAEKGRVLSVTGRMVLPTTSGLDQSSQPLGLDVGLTGAWQADANFRFHMWAVLLGSLGIGEGPAEPRGGVRLGGGVDWRPYEWIAFVLELASGFGYQDGLDLVAAQAGVRLALGTEVGLELSTSLPFFGVRALDSGALPLAATLMLSWHLR